MINELKNDKEVVLNAVQKNGAVLEYASDELKNDKEVVLQAIQIYACSLKYVSDELKNDKEVESIVNAAASDLKDTQKC